MCLSYSLHPDSITPVLDYLIFIHTLNIQYNVFCIAQQVFRSAIDSSYLPLLQDWLICSLPNFLSFPVQKAVWCLSIIFVSASINLHLIKIFPEILAKHGANGLDANADDDDAGSTQQTNTICSERDILLFCLAARDFYSRLSDEQKNRFRAVFAQCDASEFRLMLDAI